MKTSFKFLLVLALIPALLQVTAPQSSAATETIIAMEHVTATPGQTVRVPVILEGNEGICGAAISVKYSAALTLVAVDKGTALPSLTMTKPGTLTNNPIKIAWDGLEQDATDGTLVTLTFIAPTAPGRYDVQVSHETGDIVNGALAPVTVSTKNGSITVSNQGAVTKSPTICVGQVQCMPGEDIRVPIVVDGDMDVCGASLSISYSPSLVLQNVEQGEAWSSLTMTRPGDYTANPATIMWDELTGDSTNGTVAVMTFSAPQQAGAYFVKVSFAPGDIVDSNLQPINAAAQDGHVQVLDPGKAFVTVSVGTQKVKLQPDSISHGAQVVIALYRGDRMDAIRIFPATSDDVRILNTGAATRAMVTMLESRATMKPLCVAHKLTLK